MVTSAAPRADRFALTPDQLKQFHEDGYVVAERVFTNDDLQPVIDEISEELDRKAREAVAKGELSRAYEEFGFDRRLAKIDRENNTISKSMWDMKLILPSFFHLMTKPRLLDAMEQLCGPELIASSIYRLRPKVPSHDWSPVPWHQDSAYFEPYCDMSLIVTVWLPLVDSTPENGCLWVIPGAHKAGVLRHHPDQRNHYLVIEEDEFEGRRGVPVPVKKGSVLLMTNRTPHASFENKTDTVRWSMDLRYQPAVLPTNAKISRLKGETITAPEQLGVPVACNPPEPDFLVRSQRRPNEVMRTAEEFVALRKNHPYQAATDRWGYSVAKRTDPMGNPYKVPKANQG